MSETCRKGDIGVAMVLADALRRGYKAAMPVGEDWPYDLIVLRQGRLERVQCKYVRSDGRVISAKCRSTNAWLTRKYTQHDLDWIAVYDQTSGKVCYIPARLLGSGKSELKLRLVPSKNKQVKGIRWASEFERW